LSNPAPWVAGADAFLMPSRFEGMPNAALEALALGTPVIATPEAGGIGEVEGVTIAEYGPAFEDAMRRATPRSASLSASLLPDDFRIASVGRRFNELLLRAVG